ncbi:carboxyl-terminal processing protease [Pseudomonas sp. TE3786]
MSNVLSGVQRAHFSARVYAAIDQYFAHWENVSRSQFEACFQRHLEESVDNDSRVSYAQSLMRLAASLNNAHTFYFDKYLHERWGHPLGFSLYRVEQAWIVVSSGRAQLPVGSQVIAVNGQDIGAFYAELSLMISASCEDSRATRFSKSAVLWPEKFTLAFSDGATVFIDRGEPVVSLDESLPVEATLAPLYFKLKSFSRPEFEAAAIQFFRENAAAPSIILDLRGNSGGQTPVQLIGTLTAKWYWPKIAERLHRSGKVAEFSTATITHDQAMLSRFEQAQTAMCFTSPVLKVATPLFTGNLIVLINRDCASACENFILALKQRPRTFLVGERTFGSSGQPYMVSLNAEMVFAVGARREYLEDGRSLEGSGIDPDIHLPLEPEDLRRGHDAALQRAIDLVKSL